MEDESDFLLDTGFDTMSSKPSLGTSDHSSNDHHTPPSHNAAADVLLRAGLPQQQLSSEGQRQLRARIARTIAACESLDDFKYDYDLEKVRASSIAFVTIATSFPEYDADDLGQKFKASHRVADGWSVSEDIRTEAAKMGDDLRARGLISLREDAATFYSAIGALLA